MLLESYKVQCSYFFNSSGQIHYMVAVYIRLRELRELRYVIFSWPSCGNMLYFQTKMVEMLVMSPNTKYHK